jgi:hypothetical protein
LAGFAAAGSAVCAGFIGLVEYRLFWKPLEKAYFRSYLWAASPTLLGGRSDYRLLVVQVPGGILSLKNSTDGQEIPSYQTYACLGWLRQVGLIVQHGRHEDDEKEKDDPGTSDVAPEPDGKMALPLPSAADVLTTVGDIYIYGTPNHATRLPVSVTNGAALPVVHVQMSPLAPKGDARHHRQRRLDGVLGQ